MPTKMLPTKMLPTKMLIRAISIRAIKTSPWLLVAVWVASDWGLARPAACWAQTTLYTHTSGPSGDGFDWNEDPLTSAFDLPHGETFITPDVPVNYGNFTGNTTFFDANYMAAGNSGLIDGEAWWGNPLDSFSEVELGFFNLSAGGVATLQFDFAWALSGEDAPLQVELFVWDYAAGPEGEDYNTSVSVALDQWFAAGAAFGGFQGAAGTAFLRAFDLTDDNTGNSFEQIEDVWINLSPLTSLGGLSEFAIDNVTLNAELDAGNPDDSNLFPASSPGEGELAGIGTNRLRDSFAATASFLVANDGIASTEFSIVVEPGSDLEFVVASDLPTNAVIFAGQYADTGLLATVSETELSGRYEAEFRVINTLSSLDPDEVVGFSVEIFDPPLLTTNAQSPLLVDAGDVPTIENAAYGPHEGALRAGVEVTAASTTGPFVVGQLTAGAWVGPGESLAAEVTFERWGRLSGTYSGTHLIELQMNSAPGSFLNGRTPLDSVNWDLAHDHVDQLSDTTEFAGGEEYPQRLGVNTAALAATLVGGVAPSTQTASLTIVAPPAARGGLISPAIELDFTSEGGGASDGGWRALQLTYDGATLPSLSEEAELQLLWWDPSSLVWTPASLGNSLGESGEFFAGSYAEYLASLSGGTPVLGAYGIDILLDQVWGVLDYDGTFAVGVVVAGGLAADFDLDGDVDGSDLAIWSAAWGTSGGADADGDGDSDGFDLLIWQREFGATADGLTTAAPVPEPQALLLCLAATCLLVVRRV